MGFEFIGRKYEEGEKESAAKSLEKWGEKAAQPIEGELEKNEEELKMIEVVNTLLESELKKLGIETFEPIRPNQVHFLSEDIFEKIFKNKEDAAFFRSHEDAVFINKDYSDTKPRLFMNLLHECIHQASARKFHVTPDKNISNARVGYRLSSEWKDDIEEQSKLRGFNEIMNTYTSMRILYKNAEELSKLGISQEDVRGPIYSYMRYSPLLDAIVEKIAQERGVSVQRAFSNLERGQFQNNILAIKEIEKQFGKGSLQILSYLGLNTLKDKKIRDELDRMIILYFTTKNEYEHIETGAKIFQFIENLNKNDKEEKPKKYG